MVQQAPAAAMQAQQQAVPQQVSFPMMAANNAINKQQQSNSLLRLMQFCEHLNSTHDNKDKIEFWQKIIGDFFMETAMLKYTINNGKESKVFELPASVLPRFYHTFVSSGVRRIQIHLEDSRPYSTQMGYMVDCPRASVSYFMGPDTIVTSSGSLRVMFNNRFRIEWMEQVTHDHHEFINRAIMMQHLANKLESSQLQLKLYPYGVTEQVVRFLHVSETMSTMRNLMNQAMLPNSGGPLNTFFNSMESKPQPDGNGQNPNGNGDKEIKQESSENGIFPSPGPNDSHPNGDGRPANGHSAEDANQSGDSANANGHATPKLGQKRQRTQSVKEEESSKNFKQQSPKLAKK